MGDRSPLNLMDHHGMTRDDVVRMAKEVDIATGWADIVCTKDQLERFAALVAAHEREECAKIADQWFFGSIEDRNMHMAEAIRARGKQ